MKLEFDFIVQILAAVEAHPDPQMMQSELLATLKFQDNDDHGAKFYYHMMRIREAGFLKSPHVQKPSGEGFGFIPLFAGQMVPVDTGYKLTWDGTKFLEASRNDKLSKKLNKLFTDMGIEQFKKLFPVLLVEFFRSGGG